MSEKMIGELNEHTLHLALKNYIDPDPSHREIKVRGAVCDIVNESGITEIETRSFSNLSKKLDRLLCEAPVTVVFPIAAKRWLIWVEQNGELSKRKASPKKGRASDVIPELYKIRKHISSPHLTLKLIFLEEEHYKRRVGKRRGVREERIPVAFLSELDIRPCEGITDLLETVPEGEFTAKEFERANKLRGRASWYALQLLLITGQIEKIGQRGKAFIYRLKAPSA